MPRSRPRTGMAAALMVALLLSCAGVKTQTSTSGSGGGAGTTSGAGGGRGGTSGTRTDGAAGNPERAPDLNVAAEVFAHSADTLYVLNPRTKDVRRVGPFDCMTSGTMVDIAIDETGRMTASAAVADAMGRLVGQLMSVDRATAHCQVLSRPAAPITSLTYVPAGTLLPNAEALVGYSEDVYLRIDPATGATTPVGMLNNAVSGGTRWTSSGDVVSIINGGTYLTVTGKDDGQGDRIVTVDPKTGALLSIIGATGVTEILGLGYWAGVAYGFTQAGQLYSINLSNGATTPIPIPSAPADLSFLGAGTTTAAPVVE